MIFVHALATCQDIWESQIREVGAKCRVLSYDLRGHGRSSVPLDGIYSFDALADDILQLMDHLRITNADLVGISVGGEVAQLAAALHPARFRRLVLVSTACYTNPARGTVWEERMADARRLGMGGIAAATSRRWFSASYAKLHPEVLSWCEGLVAATPLASYEGLARAIQRMDLRPLIRRLPIPALVICGELDGNTGPAIGRMLADCIPESRLVIMPGVGHFPNLEAAQKFSSLCLDFLHEHEI